MPVISLAGVSIVAPSVDTEKPVITLTGASTINLVVGNVYSELGATWTDNVDGSGNAVVGGDTVNTAVAATYNVTYDYTDAAGNVGDQVTRTVIVATNVLSISLPSVSIIPAQLTNLAYVVPSSGNLDITVDAPLTGTLRYALDAVEANADNKSAILTGAVTQTVSVIGTQTLNFTGLTPGTPLYFGAYLEYTGGESNLVTLTNIQAAIPAQILAVSAARLGDVVTITTDGAIDLLAASVITGTFGGQALTGITEITSATVDFVVPDQGYDLSLSYNFVLTIDGISSNPYLSQILTPIGKGYVTLASVDANSFLVPYAGSGSNLIGAGDQVIYDSLTTDNKGVSISDDGLVTISGGGAGVDQIFDWHYLDAQDSYLKSATQTLTITVDATDTEVPIISLSGSANVTIPLGQLYLDAGATAFDNIDGDITNNIVIDNPVNVGIPGIYSITYDVTDTAGNAAVQVIRTVTVADTDIPVITLNGSSAITVELDSTWIDPGAVVSDNYDTDRTINADSTVDTSVLGQTVINYNAVDSSGNVAVQVQRTVTVEATTVSISAITQGPIYVGDTVTVSLTGANPTGKTVSIPAGILNNLSQDANSISFIVPDIKTFGTRITPYNNNILLTVNDGGNLATINFQIAIDPSYQFDTVVALNGIYTIDPNVNINDIVYGYFSSGTGTADVSTGNVITTSIAEYTYWIQSNTNSVWSDPVTISITTVEETFPVESSLSLRFSIAATNVVIEGVNTTIKFKWINQTSTAPLARNLMKILRN